MEMPSLPCLEDGSLKNLISRVINTLGHAFGTGLLGKKGSLSSEVVPRMGRGNKPKQTPFKVVILITEELLTLKPSLNN